MFGFGKRPNAPRVNQPFSENTLKAASNQLGTVLNTIASQHVRRYANIIRANATQKARKGYVSQENMNKEKEAAVMAKTSAEAAAAVAPEAQASPAAQAAETAAMKNVAGLIQKIQRGNFNNKLNNLTSNKNYNANRKNNINAAVQERRAALAGQLVVKNNL